MLLKMLPSVYSQLSLRRVPNMFTSIPVHPFRMAPFALPAGMLAGHTRTRVVFCVILQTCPKRYFSASQLIFGDQIKWLQTARTQGRKPLDLDINCLSILRVA